MALTKVSRGLISTSIVDNGNATAITIDSSENVSFTGAATFSGSVGIGTSSPVVALDVRGEIAVDYNATYGLRFYNEDRNNWSSIGNSIATGVPTANMVFKTGSGTAMTIDTSGNFSVARTDYISSSTNGFYANNEGWTHTSVSGEPTAYFNRNTSNGNIAVFQKDGTAVGSIGTISGLVTIGNTGTTGLVFDSGQIYPWNMTTNTSIDASKNLGAGGARFKDLYLSGGVYLGGTGDANKLDAYEEGAWTPVFKETNGSGTTLTVSSSTGSYIKVGNTCTITGYVIRNDTTSLTGDLVISNLPFTQAGGPQTGGSIWVDNAAADVLGIMYANNGTLMYLRSIADPNNYIKVNQFENGRAVYFSRTYVTT